MRREKKPQPASNSTKASQKTIELVKDRRALTSPINAQQGGLTPRMNYEEVARKFVADVYTMPNESSPSIRHWRGVWMKYNGRGWKSTNEVEVRKRLMGYLQKHMENGGMTTRHYTGAVMEHMISTAMVGLSEDVPMPSWLRGESHEPATNWMSFSNRVAVNVISVAKGMSLKKDSCVRPATPALFSKDFVNYPFEPKAKCPMFMRYLKSSLPDAESQNALQEMFGYLLADTCMHGVFFYLYGPTSRNGKTVTLDILRKLVGVHNVSVLGLPRLADKFATWQLTECKVNLHGEASNGAKSTAVHQVESKFKDFCDGGVVDCEKKGENPYSSPCRARFLFAANYLPHFMDRSPAIWDRMRILVFPRRFLGHERIPRLAELISKAELPGIFNWAMVGLGRVLKRRAFVETKSGLAEKETHQLTCNNEAEFLQHWKYVKGEPSDKVSVPKMYSRYKDRMRETGNPILGLGDFCDAIKSAIPGALKSRSKMPSDRTGARITMDVFFGVKCMEVTNEKVE